MELKEIREAVGARIKQKREDAGLSQGDLADALKRTRQSISAIERGVQSITTEQLSQIAKLTHTTVDYLLDGDNNTDNNFEKGFGERVRQRRLELNMSQDELAKKLGYKSRVSVCHIENGDRSLTTGKTVLLANALETTTDWLMDGDYYEDNEASDIAQEILDNSELRFLFDAARTADAETLKATREMLLILKRTKGQ